MIRTCIEKRNNIEVVFLDYTPEDIKKYMSSAVLAYYDEEWLTSLRKDWEEALMNDTPMFILDSCSNLEAIKEK